MLRRELLKAIPSGILFLSGCSERNYIEIMYAASLAEEMESEIVPEFKKYCGCEVYSEPKGSVAIVELIKDGLRKPDVAITADYRLFDELKGSFIDGYYISASNSLVIVGKRIDFEDDEWIDGILDGEITAGMSDPFVDPLGYRTLLLLKLAENIMAGIFTTKL